ncbi:unnamed protein product [Urochloa decumbens]|uniref:Protein kinase domain-containing protein n=1 Tax=Urochloa decumbens TaxID=240449 RepID=A0ABC8Z155_9POAL
MMRKVPTPPPAEETRLSDFDCIGDLGAGGFARVCKVRHRRTGAVFALKMSNDADPGAKRRPRCSAGSPHVVACHTLLRGLGGEPGCLLELMDAGFLGDILCRRRGRGLPEQALAEAARGRALRRGAGPAALPRRRAPRRQAGQLPRQLPRRDQDRRLQQLQDPLRRAPLVRFAPGARAGPLGAMSADVWSLGVTVLELFLGRFVVAPGLSDAALELAICHSGPLRVPEEAEASAELREFVAVCPQRDPAQRATVTQLLRHPFLARRDVQVSRRVLREIIVDSSM